MRLSSDLLQAFGTLAAALAALIALFVAWDQGRVMRAQQHASVMPILAAEVHLRGNEDDFELVIAVRNDGVGPAFVDSARVLSGGESMQTLDQFYDTVLPEALHSNVVLNGGTVLGVLGAGRSQQLISFTWPRTDEINDGFVDLVERVVANDDHIQIETCYCSVFDQCWVAEPGAASRATRVRSCPHPGEDVYALLAASQADSVRESGE